MIKGIWSIIRFVHYLTVIYIKNDKIGFHIYVYIFKRAHTSLSMKRHCLSMNIEILWAEKMYIYFTDFWKLSNKTFFSKNIRKFFLFTFHQFALYPFPLIYLPPLQLFFMKNNQKIIHWFIFLSSIYDLTMSYSTKIVHQVFFSFSAYDVYTICSILINSCQNFVDILSKLY